MTCLYPRDILASSAGLHPRKRVILHGKRSYSYEEAWRIVRGLASRLSRLKLKGGVVVSIPASPEFIFSVFALFEAGAVPIPVNPGYTSQELADIISSSGASALATGVAGEVSIQLFHKGSMHTYNLDELPAHAATLPSDGKAAPSDIAVMFYTSGSTGRMKGVVHTFESLCANPRSLVDIMGVNCEDVFFIGVPLFHLFGFSPGMLSAILKGAEIVLSDTIGSLGVMDRLRKDRVSVLLCNATMLQQLLTRLQGRKYDGACLRLILTSGSVAQDRLLSTAIQYFCQNTLNLYGATETGIMCQTLPGDAMHHLVTSVGKPLPGVKIRIVDDTHKDVSAGSVGEIACHTYGLFREYHGMPSVRASVVDLDGWYYTGDLGKLDEGGYLSVVGRKDEMIIKSGFNIYPREVELVLLQHSAVKDAAVVGVQDPVYGQIIRAVVAKEGNADISELDLLNLCRERLVSYKVPDQIFILNRLPQTSTGKICRNELKGEILP
jgi:fatty-acyl-CoA synthase